MAADVLSRIAWPRLAERIARRVGLHFPAERYADLQRALQAAADELALPDAAACAACVLGDRMTASQWQVLVSHLTVGETYFYRERSLFDALAQQVLPERFAARAGQRAIRLWSAACSTGEEAYSLSILLQQCLPDVDDWRASVLATDINARSLERAAQGEYGEWSFRDVPPGFRERYFERATTGRFSPRPEVRQRVVFSLLNLVEERYPSPANGLQDLDLILCRNVLMYLTPEHAAEVVRRLRRCLAPGGWLVLGVSESSHARAMASGLTPIQFEGVTFYRNDDPRSGAGAAMLRSMPEHVPPSAPTSAWLSFLPPAAGAVDPMAPAQAPGMAEGAGQVSQQARACANAGRLDEALVRCDEWITQAPLEPAARYLRAMILEETGRAEEAGRSLQQVLYLQPDFVLAHFALGNLARHAGAREAAARHFANALSLLRALPPEQELPESDGVTAGRLRDTIASLSSPMEGKA